MHIQKEECVSGWILNPKLGIIYLYCPHAKLRKCKEEAEIIYAGGWWGML